MRRIFLPQLIRNDRSTESTALPQDHNPVDESAAPPAHDTTAAETPRRDSTSLRSLIGQRFSRLRSPHHHDNLMAARSTPMATAQAERSTVIVQNIDSRRENMRAAADISRSLEALDKQRTALHKPAGNPASPHFAQRTQAQHFGKRLEALEQGRSKEQISHEAFLEQAAGVMNDLFEKKELLSNADYLIAANDLNTQHKLFTKQANELTALGTVDHAVVHSAQQCIIYSLVAGSAPEVAVTQASQQYRITQDSDIASLREYAQSLTTGTGPQSGIVNRFKAVATVTQTVSAGKNARTAVREAARTHQINDLQGLDFLRRAASNFERNVEQPNTLIVRQLARNAIDHDLGHGASADDAVLHAVQQFGITRDDEIRTLSRYAASTDQES